MKIPRKKQITDSLELLFPCKYNILITFDEIKIHGYVKIILTSNSTHAPPLCVYLISFSRKNIARISRTLCMLHHMMLVDFLSRHYTFLAYTTLHFSWMLNYMMLVEFPSRHHHFLHKQQLRVHGREHYAFYACSSTWCFITFLLNKLFLKFFECCVMFFAFYAYIWYL